MNWLSIMYPNQKEMLLIVNDKQPSCRTNTHTLSHDIAFQYAQSLRIPSKTTRWWVTTEQRSGRLARYATLPLGYQGGFCPTTQAMVRALGHSANV